MVAEMNPGNNA